MAHHGGYWQINVYTFFKSQITFRNNSFPPPHSKSYCNIKASGTGTRATRIRIGNHLVMSWRTTEHINEVSSLDLGGPKMMEV